MSPQNHVATSAKQACHMSLLIVALGDGEDYDNRFKGNL